MTWKRVFKQKPAPNGISGRSGHLFSLITIKVVPSKPFYSNIRNIRVYVSINELLQNVRAASHLRTTP